MADLELDFLFVYQESRKLLRVKRVNVCEALQEELSRFGITGARVQLAGNSGNFLLQKWSTTWNSYVDVENISELEDKDRITVVPMPCSVPESPKISKVYHRLRVYNYYSFAHAQERPFSCTLFSPVFL